MIPKTNPYCVNYYKKCCREFINDNGPVYLEVRNYTNKFIFFILQYTSEGGQTITLKSEVFGHGHSEKVNFSACGKNICYNILLNTAPYSTFVCNGTVQRIVRTYVDVEEKISGHITCKKFY